MKYSFDTSVLIEGWRRLLPPDVIPDLWQKLAELGSSRVLVATDEVLGELGRKDDEVYDWANKNRSMFVPLDLQVQYAARKILAKYKKLVAETRTRSSADPFVIALAEIRNYKVVTEEKPTNNIHKPNIPDVCRAMGIPYTNLLGLCREQGWVFVLRS